MEFDEDEQEKRDFLIGIVRGEIDSPIKRKHIRLPVEVDVQYRTQESADLIDAQLTDISIGGALLVTGEPLPMDTELILQITPPGSVSPISISGVVTYHIPSGGNGLKFLYRDAGGSRRLRELVRRLREEE